MTIDKNYECVICLEQIQFNKKKTQSKTQSKTQCCTKCCKCNIIIHTDCLQKWFKHKSDQEDICCPHCQFNHHLCNLKSPPCSCEYIQLTESKYYKEIVNTNTTSVKECFGICCICSMLTLVKILIGA